MILDIKKTTYLVEAILGLEVIKANIAEEICWHMERAFGGSGQFIKDRKKFNGYCFKWNDIFAEFELCSNGCARELI